MDASQWCIVIMFVIVITSAEDVPPPTNSTILLNITKAPVRVLLMKHPLPNYTHRPRVVHGRPDEERLLPFVVTLETDQSFHKDIPLYRVCSGSLIAKEWVLTTALCLKPRVKIVRYGDMTIPRNETKSLSKVLKLIPHPEFLGNSVCTIMNDIGLVKTTEINVNLGRLHVGDYKTFVGRVCRFAGFGLTRPDPAKLKKNELIEEQKTPLMVGEGLVRGGFGRQKMTAVSHPVLTIVPKCGTRKQWPNLGDSGGPLIIDHKIVGLYTGGAHFKDKRFSVYYYTPVSPYIDWIRKNIGCTDETKTTRYD